MKYDDGLSKKHGILDHLSRLPQKILSLHGRSDLTEFVLHDLCHERCFNLKKAAFFVDNPDFRILKGVAGYSHEEHPNTSNDMWDQPERFISHVQASPFNQKVRSLQLGSIKHVGESHEGVVQHVAQELNINNPLSCSLSIKHGNHGLLVFERTNPIDSSIEEYLSHGFSLLGFCPIY